MAVAQPCPSTKKRHTSSLLFQVMNTVMSLRRTIPVLTKEARVHPSTGVGYNLKLTEAILLFGVWQEVWQSSHTLDSQQDQPWFMTNESYCEMRATFNLV